MRLMTLIGDHGKFGGCPILGDREREGLGRQPS